MIDCDLFAILLFNEKRHDLRIRYASGHREEVVRNLSLALGEGITGNVVATGRALLHAAARRRPSSEKRGRLPPAEQ